MVVKCGPFEIELSDEIESKHSGITNGSQKYMNYKVNEICHLYHGDSWNELFNEVMRYPIRTKS